MNCTLITQFLSTPSHTQSNINGGKITEFQWEVNSIMALCYLQRNYESLCPFRVAILVDIIESLFTTPQKTAWFLVLSAYGLKMLMLILLCIFPSEVQFLNLPL